jgi:hypothetical protein
VSVIGGGRGSYFNIKKICMGILITCLNNIDFQLHNELTDLKVYLALVPKNVLTLEFVICDLFVIDLSKEDSL